MSKDPIFTAAGGGIKEEEEAENVQVVNLQLSSSSRPFLKRCPFDLAETHQLRKKRRTSSSSILALAPDPRPIPIPSMIAGRKRKTSPSSPAPTSAASVSHPIPSMISERKRKTSPSSSAPTPTSAASDSHRIPSMITERKRKTSPSSSAPASASSDPHSIPSMITGRKRKTSSSSSAPASASDPHPIHLEKKSKLMMNVKAVNINDLPDFLLAEILCRLPSKEFVFQCTSVSKRWCTLISDDPYFISRFVGLQKYQNKQTTPILPYLIDRRGREFPSSRMLLSSSMKLSAPSKSNNHLVAPLFKRLMSFHGLKQEPIVMATCYDLVLCCRTLYEQREYYICNPYTRQWVALPPTPRSKYNVPVGFICDPYCYEEEANGTSSGTLKINKDYRCTVVRILPHTTDPNFEAFKFNLEIFCFETGEWRETIVSSPQGIMLNGMCDSGFVYNGMLYWQTTACAGMIGLGPFNNYNTTTSSNIGDHPEFCCFDLVDEHVSDEHVQFIQCTGVHRGCLQVWGYDNLNGDLIVWELKGVAGLGKLCVENSRVYAMDPEVVPDLAAFLAFDPSDDEDIFYVCNIDMDREDGFFAYVAMHNIRTREWSKIAFQDDPNDKDIYIGIDPCLFRLAFPWWPTPVPTMAHG